MLKNKLPLGLIFILLVAAGSCTNINQYAYKQIILTDEQARQALENAPPSFKDSTITLALGPNYDKTFIHRWVWGNRNRKLWTIPATFEVLDLKTEKGGLKPVKRGGGMQTKGLRLVDKDGHEYDLRSVNKEPATALPKIWRKTFLAGIVRDQTSAMHPYGPLVAPKLAKAAGLFYLQPKYVFIPYDPALGEFAQEFGGMVALLEPHPDKDHPMLKQFGDIEEMDNSQEALEKRFSSQKVSVDQRMFAKARLFDMWIGDWDRHEGQWTWAGFKENGKLVYKPIGEDRDQIFYRLSDGWLSWLLTQVGPLKKLQSFSKKEIDAKSYAYNARFIDKRMLYKLNKQDWAEVAQQLQTSLTDAAIEDALKELPPPVYTENAAELNETLKERRKQLPQVAMKFYKLLSRSVEIPGTDMEEKFVITRVNDNETLVEIFSDPKKGEEPEKLFSRTFYRNETKHIYLYGLRGEDKFDLSGKVKKGITIHIIGGTGEDKVTDQSEVQGWTKRTKVYDTRFGVEIEGREAKDKTRKTVKVHAFDMEGL